MRVDLLCKSILIGASCIVSLINSDGITISGVACILVHMAIGEVYIAC